MDLYENIKKRRIELGMTQEDLAKKIGYRSTSTIAKIERGVNDIPQSKIKAFAEALNVTPGELMGDVSCNDSFELRFAVSLNEEILIKKYRQLNASDKQEILNMIDFKLFQYEKSSEEDESNCV